MSKYKYTKKVFEMRCYDDRKGLHFESARSAYRVDGEGLPDGLPLFVHRWAIRSPNSKGDWISVWKVSEGLSGIQFPNTWGYTRDEAVNEVLATIGHLGHARVWTEMFYVSNELRKSNLLGGETDDTEN